MNKYEIFKNQKNTQIFKYTEYLIKSELANLLPKLTDIEKTNRDNMIKNLSYNTVNRKDNLKDFYDDIRKKYTENKELAYLSDWEFLHELYNYVFNYDILKKNFIDSDFDLTKTLVWLIDQKIVEKDLKENFMAKKSQSLINNSTFCLNISFDDDFFQFLKTSEFETLVNLVKYDSSLQSDSIVFYQNIYYDQLDKFFNEFFYDKIRTRRIIYRITDNQKLIETKTTDAKKVFNYMNYAKLDEFEFEDDCNSIFNTLFRIILNELPNIEVLILIAESDLFFRLDKINSEILIRLIENKDSIDVFSIRNIGLHEDCELEFAEKLNLNKQLKFVTVKGTRIKMSSLCQLENIGVNKGDFIYGRVSK